MAKPNNSGRTKRSHGSKPYDTSSSFVKRFTTRVSEILPQPSSWVSKFFSPAPKLNVRAREESDDEDEEEEERRPPSKRHCLGRVEERDYSHQNNINRLNAIGQGSVEISPILNNRLEEDLAVPGPSGLHLRNFVSSTPAVQQANTQPSPSRTPNLVKRTQVSDLKRNATRRSSLNLSNSFSGLNSPSQPSFDTYVFKNPLNKSGLRPRSSLNESCFYPGETTFGGSSARVSLIAEQPRARVVNVTASPAVQRDTIGTSALRILKALEQFSTPVLDAKKIPVRTEGVNPRKRKPPQPYEELIFPTMPELLSFKRRETVAKQPAPAEAPLQPVPSTSTTTDPPKSVETAPPMSKPVVSASTIDTQYSIRPESSKEVHVGSIKRGQKDADIETETVPELNLPNVQLKIASLPKFELSASSQLVKPLPQAKKPVVAPSSPPEFKFSEPDILEKVSSDKIIVNYQVKAFKFSDPLPSIEIDKKPPAPQHNSFSKKNILEVTVPNMKVSSPNFKLKRKTIESTPKVESIKSLELKMPPEMKTGSIMEVFNLNNTQPLEKQFKPSENNLYCHKCKASYDKDKGKCTCENSISSVKPSSPEAYRSKQECKKCQLVNDNSELKCNQCNLEKGSEDSKLSLKGFEGYRKPTDIWECTECFVQNKDVSEACVSCSTPKAGKSSGVKPQASFTLVSTENKTDSAAIKSTPLAPIVNSIHKSQGSWECDTCLVQNKADITSCVACSTPKPGSAPAEKPKLAFSFGIPAPALETNSFHFGADTNAQKNDVQPQVSLGSLNEDKKNNKFNFGNEQRNDMSKTSIALPPLANSFKKSDNWECGTCLVKNKNDVTSCIACSTPKPDSNVAVEKSKQAFSFGMPNSSLGSANVNNVQFGSNFSTQKIDNTSIQSQAQFLFGSQPDEKKSHNAPDFFKFGSSDTKSNNEYKPVFSFMNSDKPKENDQNKQANPNLFLFGSNKKENKIDDAIAVDGKPPKKKVSFGNPLTSEKHINNDSNSTMFGNVMSSKPNAIVSSNFSFTAKSPFENNSTIVPKEPTKETPVVSFVFGSAEPNNANIRSSIPEPAKPMSFIIPPTEPSVISSNDHTNSQSIFGGPTFTSFNKPSEPENKPFSFLGNSQGNQGGGQFTFNAVSSTPATVAVEPFGNQQPPIFSQQQASSIFSQHQVEPKPFVFAAPQQPQPSPFTFGAPQGAGIGGNTAFGGFSQPANPAPVFDPNAKPTFNFTGGSTPSFSAAPTVNSTGAEGGPEKRRVRKAIRRTQPR